MAVPGLGENVAKRIVEAREEGPFLSKEDLNKKAGLSQKVIDYLDEMGSLPDLPDKAQLSILICNDLMKKIFQIQIKYNIYLHLMKFV